MSSITLNHLKSALDKSRDIGILEKKIDIPGMSLVIRTLRPDEITWSLDELEDYHTRSAQIFAWQKLQLSRAIVEVNGVDLRSVRTVDLEDGTKLELHEALSRNLIDTWSKDLVLHLVVALTELSKESEDQIKKSMAAYIVSENAEEKLRECLIAVKDAEEAVPPKLAETILKEFGLVRQSSVEELKAALEKEPIRMVESPPPAPTEKPKDAPAVVVPPAPVVSGLIPKRTAEISALEGLAPIANAPTQPAQMEVPELFEPGEKPDFSRVVQDPAPTLKLNPRTARR
jgi:hypothetical protein